MAYDSSKLRQFAATDLAAGGGAWIYGPQPDAHATVEGAAYFTDGGKRGMKVGDLVLVIESAGGGTTAHSVTELAAAPAGSSDKTPGAATISAGQFA